MLDMERLISFRVAEGTYESMRAEAERSGLSLSAWIRRTLGVAADEASDRERELERRMARLEGMAGL